MFSMVNATWSFGVPVTTCASGNAMLLLEPRGVTISGRAVTLEGMMSSWVPPCPSLCDTSSAPTFVFGAANTNEPPVERCATIEPLAIAADVTIVSARSRLSPTPRFKSSPVKPEGSSSVSVAPDPSPDPSNVTFCAVAPPRSSVAPVSIWNAPPPVTLPLTVSRPSLAAIDPLLTRSEMAPKPVTWTSEPNDTFGASIVPPCNASVPAVTNRLLLAIEPVAVTVSEAPSKTIAPPPLTRPDTVPPASNAIVPDATLIVPVAVSSSTA